MLLHRLDGGGVLLAGCNDNGVHSDLPVCVVRRLAEVLTYLIHLLP